MTTVNLLFFALGIVVSFLYYRKKLGHLDQLAQTILQRAELEADETIASAKVEAKKFQLEEHRALEIKRAAFDNRMEKSQNRLHDREDRLNELESEMDRREKRLRIESHDIDQRADVLTQTEFELVKQLERAASLTKDDAKQELMKCFNRELEEETRRSLSRHQEQLNLIKEEKSASILSTVIGRISTQFVSQRTTQTIAIPSDDLKGRLIGREGRNIRTLEHECGVNVIIDDKARCVQISCFDPIRLFIAKKAINELFSDGRIHPTKIRAVIEDARRSIPNKILKEGEKAASLAGVFGLHIELIKQLGALHFQSSLGQNVLQHSVEVSQIMALLASELQLDSKLAARIGLLHDIGKASSAVDRSHALAGYDFAIKYGEGEKVANGIGCHHFEMTPQTIEGSLCATADAISAARPGARIEAIEEYIKRNEELEKIAISCEGVEKAHALQAGRELRVIVSANLVSEARAPLLAREIAKKVEETLSYPGRIQVTVSREKNIVEYAY